MKKRILSLFMAICMIAGLVVVVPTTASAVEYVGQGSINTEPEFVANLESVDVNGYANIKVRLNKKQEDLHGWYYGRIYRNGIKLLQVELFLNSNVFEFSTVKLSSPIAYDVRNSRPSNNKRGMYNFIPEEGRCVLVYLCAGDDNNLFFKPVYLLDITV